MTIGATNELFIGLGLSTAISGTLEVVLGLSMAYGLSSMELTSFEIKQVGGVELEGSSLKLSMSGLNVIV